MSRNETNKSAPPLLAAAMMCLLCVPAIYLATRPLVWLLSAAWAQWMIAGLFVFVPLLAAFLVLYESSWHDDQPRFRRLVSTMASSLIVFGIDLLLAGALLAIGCLIVAQSRSMGGN